MALVKIKVSFSFGPSEGSLKLENVNEVNHNGSLKSKLSTHKESSQLLFLNLKKRNIGFLSSCYPEPEAPLLKMLMTSSIILQK